MKWLYDSVVVPKMYYAIDVWGAEMVSRLGNRAGRKGQSKVLGKVLRTHALTTTGGMRTTATDVAVTHANLMPLPFLLRKLCFRAYTRMTTLPKSHPIHDKIGKQISNASITSPCSTTSPSPSLSTPKIQRKFKPPATPQNGILT